MRKFAIQCLDDFGWRINVAGCIPRKSIMTGAGHKEAYAYFMSDDGGNEVLNARHQSAGQNILQPVSVLIPTRSSNECIRGLIERFVHDAEIIVSDHYAAERASTVCMAIRKQPMAVCGKGGAYHVDPFDPNVPMEEDQ